MMIRTLENDDSSVENDVCFVVRVTGRLSTLWPNNGRHLLDRAPGQLLYIEINERFFTRKSIFLHDSSVEIKILEDSWRFLKILEDSSIEKVLMCMQRRVLQWCLDRFCRRWPRRVRFRLIFTVSPLCVLQLIRSVPLFACRPSNRIVIHRMMPLMILTLMRNKSIRLKIMKNFALQIMNIWLKTMSACRKCSRIWLRLWELAQHD